MIGVLGLLFATSLFVAYSPAAAQFCQPLNDTLFKRCISNAAGYNYTFISNNSDFKGVEELLSFIVKTEISNLAACSGPVSELLVCSLYVPRCVEARRGPILPCRRICHEVVRSCEASNETLFYDDLEWIKGMCQFLPDDTGDSGNCLEPTGFKPRYPTGKIIQKCVPLIPNVCSSLGYSYTTYGMENQKRSKSIVDNHLSHMMGNHDVCAPIMKKIICAEFLPPCYPEENGKPALYTACKSDCEMLQEKCPEHFKKQLGNLGYCLELANANKTEHGFCKLTQWPAAGRWPNYVPPTLSTTLTANTKDHPTNPVSTDHPTNPVSTDHPTNPVSTGHPTNPVSTDHPTHPVSNQTGPVTSTPGLSVTSSPTLKHGEVMARSGSKHHVPLGAIIAPAILASLLLIVAALVIHCKRRKRSEARGKNYRRQRNESETTEI